jgi:hypothetical protein
LSSSSERTVARAEWFSQRQFSPKLCASAQKCGFADRSDAFEIYDIARNANCKSRMCLYHKLAQARDDLVEEQNVLLRCAWSVATPMQGAKADRGECGR